MAKTIQIDTEFHSSNEKHVHPVCATIRENGIAQDFWLEDSQEERARFAEVVRGYAKTHTIVAFYISAEVRCLMACGVPFEEQISWVWLDPWIMWRMLTHSHPEFRYGRQVVIEKDGKKSIITSKAPLNRQDSLDTWSEDESGELVHKKAPRTCRPVPVSLAGAIMHRFGIDVDTEHKTQMRDLILSKGPYSDEDREAIMAYCRMDTEHLLPLVNDLWKNIFRLSGQRAKLSDFSRMSRYMVCCAKMESNGIPFREDYAQNLGGNYRQVDDEIIEQLNTHYGFFRREKSSAKDRREGKGEMKWVADEKSFAEYVREAGLENAWPKSPAGKFKQDRETLKDYKSDPTLDALRIAKESRNQIKYFRPEGYRKIRSNIGSDGRIRVLLSPFGSKTGRNQPSVAAGYVYGMSTWFRPLIEHPDLIVQGADFSAQEIALQGWCSGDAGFLGAYVSGDPYTWFAQMTGLMPEGTTRSSGGFQDAKKKPYDKAMQAYCKGVRAVCKALMLGVGFGMGLDKLAASLTKARLAALPAEKQNCVSAARLSDASEAVRKLAAEIMDSIRVYPGIGPGSTLVPKDQSAHTYREYHKKIFKVYWAWRDAMLREYAALGSLRLADGWSLFEGEDRPNTIANFKVQGTGAVILRAAVEKCLLAGLHVIAPLHDCIYILSHPSVAEAELSLLKKLMREAVIEVCGEDLIRIDGDAYSTNWEEGVSTWTKEKQAAEFARFRKYMMTAGAPTNGPL